MSAESSPLDVVGLSPSSESPAPSPGRARPFVARDPAAADKTDAVPKEEPMEDEDGDVTTDDT